MLNVDYGCWAEAEAFPGGWTAARGHDGEGMAENLPLYVKPGYFKMVKEMPGWAEKDWDVLKCSMKENFVDEDLFRYSLADLHRFVARIKRKGRPTKLSGISKIYFKFAEITTYLKKKRTISAQEETRYFLSLLPADLVNQIYARQDTRQMVLQGSGGSTVHDESHVPVIEEVMTEIRAILVGLAKRGEASAIRTEHQWSSSESDSDSADYSQGDSESDMEPKSEKEAHKSKWNCSRDNSSAASSDSSDTPSTRIKVTKHPRFNKSANPEDARTLRNLLTGFRELKVAMAELASSQAAATPPILKRRSSWNGEEL